MKRRDGNAALAATSGLHAPKPSPRPQTTVELMDALQVQQAWKWWAMTGSNCRHLRCKRSALPTELIALPGRTCKRSQRVSQAKIGRFQHGRPVAGAAIHRHSKCF